MGITNFIIVLLFNIFWTKDGIDNYFKMYKWSENKFISVAISFYAVWGIYNLIYACL